MPRSPTREPRRSGLPAEDGGDLRLYHRRFSHLSRGQLEVRNRALYHRLRRAGLLHHVPLKQRPRRAISDLLAYYRDHYPGVTRGRLAALDSSLYSRLRNAGLLANIPTTTRSIPDPLAYYRRQFAGLSRSELRSRDSGLYQRLCRAGLLGKIPVKRRERKRAGGGQGPGGDSAAKGER